MVTREWGSLLEEDLGIEPGSLVPHPPAGGGKVYGVSAGHLRALHRGMSTDAREL